MSVPILNNIRTNRFISLKCETTLGLRRVSDVELRRDQLRYTLSLVFLILSIPIFMTTYRSDDVHTELINDSEIRPMDALSPTQIFAYWTSDLLLEDLQSVIFANSSTGTPKGVGGCL